MTVLVPPPAVDISALDPGVVPGAVDEPPLISADMHPPVDLAEDLERFNGRLAAYLKADDVARIGAAYVFADSAHRGQLRLSGAPYITHPLAVAETLAGWQLDPHAVTAALLHDVMEDTSITKEQIAERFGKVTAELVDGVSKLDRIEHQSFEEAQAENFRKMLLAMARDVRVILIKLADRLHNMQTLDAMRPEKRRRIARETLEIYAPLANRLGLNSLYSELHELAFRHAHPLRYSVLSKAVKGARGNRRAVVGKTLDAIRKALPAAGIDAQVMGREKHLYSIYRKMRDKQLSFSQVLDIYGFRIIVKDRPTCYLALGALHGLYQPVPGKFKDYIAIPKANGYQSLHTTLIGPFGTPVEIQIRDAEMHNIAESGVASHWMYKDESALGQLAKKTHKWLKSLVELQSTTGDSSEFLEHVKVDLFPSEVYVFSPKGKIFALPRGSTPVDLAYAVHTDIGDRCIACRINFETMPLRTELRNGDRVEIITAPNAAPSPAWLGYVKTARARSKIRHFLSTQQTAESAALGERLLAHALRDLGLALTKLPAKAWDRFKRASGARSERSVLADIGLGKRLPAIVARRLAQGVEPWAAGVGPGDKTHQAIPIRGADGAAIRLGACCQPIPGDPIVGVIRKGQGLVVHTHDCRTIAKLRSERGGWVDVEWEADISGMFEASIRVVAKNVRGVLAGLAARIAETDSNIVNISMDDDSGDATTLYFTLQVSDRSHLARIMVALRRVQEVIRITRYVDPKH